MSPAGTHIIACLFRNVQHCLNTITLIVEELIAGIHRGCQLFVLLRIIHTLLVHISTLIQQLRRLRSCSWMISSMPRRQDRRRRMSTRTSRTNHRVFLKQRRTKQTMWSSYSAGWCNPVMKSWSASNLYVNNYRRTLIQDRSPSVKHVWNAFRLVWSIMRIFWGRHWFSLSIIGWRR